MKQSDESTQESLWNESSPAIKSERGVLLSQ